MVPATFWVVCLFAVFTLLLQGHCVVVFNDDGQFQRRIGTDSITNFPNGIDISDAGDILVGDSHGNRFHVAVFQRDGSLIGERQSLKPGLPSSFKHLYLCMFCF